MNDIEKRLMEQEARNRLYHAPNNRWLRNASIIVIALVIAMQVSMIIWMEDIPYKVMLFMRGCVGLGAIIFAIMITILTYRVNSQHIKERNHKKNDD